jgi:hypothetical protein
MGIQGRRAIRAKYPEILDAIVVANTVDVVENQGHLPAVPLLFLSALLTFPLLQPLRVKSPLEGAARIA